MEAPGDPGVDCTMTAAEIQSVIEGAGLQPLAPDAGSRFGKYLELLLKWNAGLNLTAIREPVLIAQRHFIESIFAAQHLLTEIATLLDFGSGGGFPGIPIAICRPDVRVTLAESQGKKAAFLREAVRTLELKNAEVYGGRVEALDRQFEAVTLRAVDKMLDACRVALGKLAPGGHFLPFTTLNGVPALTEALVGVVWNEPLLLPRSDRRVLLMGRKQY